MSVKEFVVALKDKIAEDDVTDMAASCTYYGVLALFPFVLFLVSLATLVIDPHQAEQIVQQLGQVAPGPATQILGDRIRTLASQQHVGLLTVGALGALWAASGATLAVMRALDTTYDVTEGRPFWKVRLVALLMTIVSGVLALVGALVAVAAAPLANAVGGPLGTAITWLRLPVAGLVMMLLWALAYYVLPDVEQKFRFITPGSVGGVVLWLVASWLFSLYVSNFGNYDATYGPLGGVIVLLLWMWISALVLLVGAEANALLEHRSVEGKEAGGKELEGPGKSRAPRPRHPEAQPPPPEPDAVVVARAAERERARRGPRPSGHEPHPRLAVLLAGLAAGLFAGSRRA
jgi:membrane protein